MAARTSIRRLLLVEDNLGDAQLLREMFHESGSYNTEVLHVESLAEAESRLADRSVDIILLDLGLPDAQGVPAVRRAQAAAPRVPLVVLTGLDDEDVAELTLQEGAQDYLVKGQIDSRGLLRALRYAIERKILEEALFVEKERAQVTLGCIGDAIACTDRAGKLTFLNVVAEKMTGWSSRDATGVAMTDVFRILDATSRETIQGQIELGDGKNRTVPLPSNCILMHRDGSSTPIEDSVAAIHDRDGNVTGTVVVFRDVSAARETALRIAHSAHHDFLTGLPNRMLLGDRLGRAITLAQRHDKKGAVLFLDLDGFKHVNDSLGHQFGDRLLQSVSGRLTECLRGSDTVSRQGGDEFVVLLSEVEHAEDAAITARRMLEAVAAPHSIDGYELRVTTSIGVSVFPDDGLEAESLIRNADTAMYQAKANGRHSYQFFEPGMNVGAVERQFVEESLRRALERRELSLHYQPKVDLATGAITGAEALLRWTHPDRGLIPPMAFIPVAEDCGLILPIGRWVLQQACRQAREWARAGLPKMTMAVNVSAVEVRSPTFLDGLHGILEETGMEPQALQLDLSESTLMANFPSMEVTLSKLRARGLALAIDDFGTGHSSLSTLRKLSIDILKIHRSFVKQITAEPAKATIAAAVLGLGHNLDLRVVAQGVETREELAFLQERHCDEGQGYYFSKPLPPHEFAALLESGMPAGRVERIGLNRRDGICEHV
jgi:diguanylate cyclase (GGDEF)-like protein/PAS domain S-box-containing protein